MSENREEYYASGICAYRELYGLVPVVPALVVAGLSIHPVSLAVPLFVLFAATCLVLRSRKHAVFVIADGQLRSPKWLKNPIPMHRITCVEPCSFGDLKVTVDLRRIRLPAGLICSGERAKLVAGIQRGMTQTEPAGTPRPAAF